MLLALFVSGLFTSSLWVGACYALTHVDIKTDGKGEGFGNKISIQTVDIVKAAKVAGRVYKVDDGKPVCDFLVSLPT